MLGVAHLPQSQIRHGRGWRQSAWDKAPGGRVLDGVVGASGGQARTGSGVWRGWIGLQEGWRRWRGRVEYGVDKVVAGRGQKAGVVACRV